MLQLKVRTLKAAASSPPPHYCEVRWNFLRDQVEFSILLKRIKTSNILIKLETSAASSHSSFIGSNLKEALRYRGRGPLIS